MVGSSRLLVAFVRLQGQLWAASGRCSSSAGWAHKLVYVAMGKAMGKAGKVHYLDVMPCWQVCAVRAVQLVQLIECSIFA